MINKGIYLIGRYEREAILIQGRHHVRLLQTYKELIWFDYKSCGTFLLKC